MAADVARLPECVVVGVLEQVVPERDLVVEVLRVDVGERADVQVEAVAVGRGRREVDQAWPRHAGRLGPRRAEAAVEANRVREVERAVVVKIVAHEPLGDGGLRRGGFERRMRGNHAGRRVVARIGDAPHPDPAVVRRDILDQPVDGVEGIGALIDTTRAARRGRVGAERPDVGVSPLGHPRTADVLVDEGEAILHEQVGWAQAGPVGVRAVGRHVRVSMIGYVCDRSLGT